MPQELIWTHVAPTNNATPSPDTTKRTTNMARQPHPHNCDCDSCVGHRLRMAQLGRYGVAPAQPFIVANEGADDTDNVLPTFNLAWDEDDQDHVCTCGKGRRQEQDDEVTGNRQFTDESDNLLPTFEADFDSMASQSLRNRR